MIKGLWFADDCILSHSLSCSVCYEDFFKAILFSKRFLSFLGFFESLLSTDQQPLLLTGKFSITQLIWPKDRIFSIHPWTDLNFLELRSTKFSVFKLNSFAFHFTFHYFTFWTRLPRVLTNNACMSHFQLVM